MSHAAPILLLAGGPGSDPETTGRALSAAVAPTRRRDSVVAYIGTASGDNAGFLARIGGWLRAAGAGEVRLAPLAGRHADPDAARLVLERADAVFVSGGDVEEGVEALRRTDMLPCLRSAYDDGKPFIGLSAGSIMLGLRWVRWTDPENDSTAASFACMGLAPVLCDTHAEDDDWVELHALLRLEGDGATGYGIGSGSALRVLPDGSCEAVEDGVVRFVNRRGRILPTRVGR